MNKNKPAIIIQLIIWTVLAAILLSVTIGAFSGGFIGTNSMRFNIGINFGDADNLQFEKEFDADAAQSITLNLQSQGVEIMPYSGDTVKVQYYTSNEKAASSITADINSDTITVASSDIFSINLFAFTNEKIVISVPSAKSYNYNVNISSGNFTANDIYINSLMADITSGSVKINALGKAESVYIKTTSGSIKASINADNAYVKTTSGSVKLSGEMETIEAGATSGSLKISCTKQPKSFVAKLTSGDVKLYLPSDVSGFTYKGSLSSGSAYESFGGHKMSDTYTLGDGAVNITANITSGSFKILPLE